MSGLATATANKIVDHVNSVSAFTAPATRTAYQGVSVQPAGSTEDVRDRELLVGKYMLYTSRGFDIDLLATDRVEWNGITLQVDGDPNRWPAPGGGVHHVEAALKQVSG
jgi:hypothetical protein